MGWMLGCAGKTDPALLEKLGTLCGAKPLSTNEFMTVWGGGLPRTFHHTVGADSRSGWLACGIGFRSGPQSVRMMNRQDWADFLAAPDPDPNHLNGHFAYLRWQDQHLHFRSDPIGLRSLYFLDRSDHLIFSTRQDWLLSLQEKKALDWGEFGAHWLAINQFSHGSFFKGLDRISQGGRATYANGTFSHQNTPWHPDLAPPLFGDDFSQNLKAFTLAPLPEETTLSLALSGGLDSRVLLAILLAGPDRSWEVHSFKEPGHPDRRIAESICRANDLKQVLLPQPVPDAGTCLRSMREYLGQTMMAAPAFGFINLQFYDVLREKGRVVVDGGAGEIARRRFLTRLLLGGKKHIRNGDSQQAFPLLRGRRADIFTPEVVQEMENGARRALAHLWEKMPAVGETGIPNWLDLMAIRCRFSNLFGPEQSRSDSLLTNFMPFVQPSLLRSVFHTPLRQRQGGRIFRRIIAQNASGLTRFPLVKNDLIYPYRFSTVPASLWIAGKSRLGFAPVDHTPALFLNTIGEYVRDLAASQAVREYTPYRKGYIAEMVDDFYGGNHARAGEIGWWLTFDFWR